MPEAVSSPQPTPQRTNSSGQVQAPPRQQIAYVSNLALIIQILSARTLGLLGVIGGIAIFGFAIYDPSQIRAATAGIYACGVLWPLIWLYLRKE